MPPRELPRQHWRALTSLKEPRGHRDIAQRTSPAELTMLEDLRVLAQPGAIVAVAAVEAE